MSLVKNFPFVGIAGQDQMKLALMLNIIDPQIGGVIVFGERGTGKSTTIRSLVDLLPEIYVIKNDPFNTDPFENGNSIYEFEKIKIPMIDLPLGTTEDRLCGAINFKELISTGKNVFEPGLLARANRGLLYVDEINLLDDHLVDILLDSSASGWNIVERDGISIKHPSKFIIIGSGNPEEGELRPQLLDRFGLHVEIHTVKDPSIRVKIVEERLNFDSEPELWLSKYKLEQEKIQIKLGNAQSLRKNVKISREYQFKLAQICSDLGIEGLRGDIVCARAAKALAAYEGRKDVIFSDLYNIIELCLKHRLRKNPMDNINGSDKIYSLFKKYFIA